jgi:flagellar motor switch protein FliM
MSLCIPYLVLKPITTKLSAQKWFAGSNRRTSPSSRRILSFQVNNAPVDCTVRLGGARLSINDFLALRPGDVLKIDRKTEQDLDLQIEGVPKFVGKPALQGKKLVFSVTDSISE